MPNKERMRAKTIHTTNRTPTIKQTDRKSTRLNSSHTVIYTLSLHDALPISHAAAASVTAPHHAEQGANEGEDDPHDKQDSNNQANRSEEHTSELQSHSDLHSFPTRRSSDLPCRRRLRNRPPSCRTRSE